MFETHKLNDKGFSQVKSFKEAMSEVVRVSSLLMNDGREKAIFETKIEEAVFFGTKAIANNPSNHTETINY